MKKAIMNMRAEENLEYKLKKEQEQELLLLLSEPLRYTKGILNKKYKKELNENKILNIKDINIKELFYDSLSNSNELLYEIEEEKLKAFDSYNENLDYIDNIHNILFELYIKEITKYLKYNYKLKNINFEDNINTKKDEEIETLLKYIKEDKFENMSINKKIYIYKENSILRNEEYFKKTIKLLKEEFKIRKINENFKDYIFCTVLNKKMLKDKNNPNGFVYNDKGQIQAFYDFKNKILIPDFNTMNNKPIIKWNKEFLKNPTKIIKSKGINYNKFKILKYIEERTPILSNTIITNEKNLKIEKVDIEKELLYENIFSNNVSYFSFLDLISEELVFSLKIYLKDKDDKIYLKEKYIYIEEVTDFLITYKNNEIVKNIKDFIYLDSYKEELYLKKGILKLKDDFGNYYDNLYEIEELQNFKYQYKILKVLPKQKIFEKDILRLTILIDIKNNKFLKEIKKKYYIIEEEPLYFNNKLKNTNNKFKNYYIFNENDLNSFNILEYYEYILKNIPQQELENIEILNRNLRKNFKLKNKITYYNSDFL